MKKMLFSDGDYILVDDDSIAFYDCDDCLVERYEHDEEMADSVISMLRNKEIVSYEPVQ